MSDYWNKRFQSEGMIWGEFPSRTAEYALELFSGNDIETILIPGSGYGRNTRLFSESGFDVTGIEISSTAHEMALKFDPSSRFYRASVLDMSFDNHIYDAVYCHNVLHLFRENDRILFIQECLSKVRDDGLLFFTVFSEKEPSYGKGEEVERNTFESKPGRPAHYFTESDLQKHFKNMKIVETDTIEDPEDHGGEPHIHILRYICLRR